MRSNLLRVVLTALAVSSVITIKADSFAYVNEETEPEIEEYAESVFDGEDELVEWCFIPNSDIEWKFYKSGHLEVFGTGDMPETDSISAPWSKYREQIKSVEVSEGITSIRSYAFGYTTNLKSVKLPSSLKTIGVFAFIYDNALETIEIPVGVEEIGRGAFQYCESLNSVGLPDSLKRIGDYAFSDCALTELRLPKNVEEIGICSFSGNGDGQELTSISVDAGNTSIAVTN